MLRDFLSRTVGPCSSATRRREAHRRLRGPAREDRRASRRKKLPGERGNRAAWGLPSSPAGGGGARPRADGVDSPMLVERRLKMIMTCGSHASVTVEREKGVRLEEREGQPGHFAHLADLDLSWTAELA
jgi:hypothetical protein